MLIKDAAMSITPKQAPYGFRQSSPPPIVLTAAKKERQISLSNF